MRSRGGKRVIARMWSGITPAAKAGAYVRCLRETGVRECLATPGNRGVLVLRRMVRGRAQFVFLSLWSSRRAIRAFAGPDPERAVYYQRDRSFLASFPRIVDHYEAIAFAPSGAGGRVTTPSREGGRSGSPPPRYRHRTPRPRRR
ncbi:MAG: antibiotic biosynthesis monooxygenase [Candidatus Polarisedimenticolia bacterium]